MLFAQDEPSGSTLLTLLRRRTKALCQRFRACLISDSTPLSPAEILRSASAAFVAVLSVGWISSHFASGLVSVVMVASIGASAVLLFATPHSPLAQPWPLVGGYLLSALIGVTCAHFIPYHWIAAAFAVALSISVMLYTHSLHPPASAVALLAVVGGAPIYREGYLYVLYPVGLNALLMLVAALIINNLLRGRRYPAQSGPKKDLVHHHDDPTPLSRLGLDRQDLHSALRDLDVFLDISEDDLDQVYHRAGLHAFRRKMENIRCGDIMSRDVMTAEFDTELAELWARLRFHRIKAMPVLDSQRRVIGIATLVDFLKRVDLKTYETFIDRLTRFIRPSPGVEGDKPRVAGQIMTSPAFTVRADMHIAELVDLMSDQGLHHIPVVEEDGRLAGMVTQTDLIAALYHGCITKE